MSSNIPSGLAYGIYVSQLVRIGCICNNNYYDEFVGCNRLITTKLIRQGFHYTKLVRTFKKFYRKYVSLMDRYGVCLRRHISEGICRPYISIPSLYRNVTLHRQQL